MKQYGLYIDGQWTASQTGATFKVTNPATGEVVGTVADASVSDVKNAIEVAHLSFSKWSGLAAKERSLILYRVYDLMMKHKEELAILLTSEQGKPLAEARGEIDYAADFFLWYAEESKRVYGDTIPASTPYKRLFAIKQPVGVVAAITPWNFPAAMITRKIAPALAVGCTVIIKPAKQTPLTACRLVELMEEAGIPQGVVNLINSTHPREIGTALLEDERVRKVTFTGSTEVGKLIMRQAADTVKRVSLELGGHAPLLVFEDADMDVVVQQVIASKFRNAGQTCICTNRIYVQETIAKPFAEMLVSRVKAMKVGNGIEAGVEIGPLINHNAIAKVEKHVQDAVAKGATVLAGGQSAGVTGAEPSLFYQPTVLINVTDEMLVQQEETFGPVTSIQIFQTEEEAISKANDTRFGLAAYLFTRDITRAVRVAEKLEYGIVGVNDGVPSVAQAPFGGYKESGLGREGGKYGIEEFLEIKYISLQLN